MIGKLFASVCLDSHHTILVRGQQFDGRRGNLFGAFVFYYFHHGELTLYLYDDDQRLFVVFADHCIDLPIVDATLFVNNLRAPIYAHCIANLASLVFVNTAPSIAFPLASQVVIEFSAFSLVAPDVSIGGLVTDLDTEIQSKSSRGLLRAQILSQCEDIRNQGFS